MLGSRNFHSGQPAFEPLEPRLLLALTGDVPILFIVVEGGPGYEHDLHPSHNADYFSGLLDGSGGVGAPVSATQINYSDTPGSNYGHVGPDAAFPEGDGDDFVVRATAELFVGFGDAGVWTFGINSDDGARLTIDNTVVIEDDAIHGTVDHFGRMDLSWGAHTLELVYFERGGVAAVELFAAPGEHEVFDASFELISTDGPGLNTTSKGFEVVQRFSTQVMDSLADADFLLAQPYHSVVGYFEENSNGRLNLKPAIAGEIDPATGLAHDGAADGVVGPYEFPTVETDAHAKRRLSIQLADWSGDFDFSVYDINGDGWLGQDELIIVSIGSDEWGNEFWRFLPDPQDGQPYEYSDFVDGSFSRSAGYDAGYGRYFDIIRGTRQRDGQEVEFQYRYYAHPNPPPTRDYWPRAEAEAHGAALGGSFHGYGTGGNCWTIDNGLILSSGLNVSKYFYVPGCGDWTSWMTLVHEISHVVSLEWCKDLYHYEDDGGIPAGINLYATMGGTGGRTYHHDPWTKFKLGWVNPLVISTPGWYTLPAVETSGEVYIIQRNFDEYFLIENRWPGTSYDGASTSTRDVPGLAAGGLIDAGLGIWHIDETRLDEFDNNDWSAPPFIAKEDGGQPGVVIDDLWDGTKAFTAVSTPSSAWNDGTDSDVVIAHVSAPGPYVTFWVGFDGVVPDGYEPNDSYEFAANLGAGDRSIADLTMHRNNQDYFRWVAPDNGMLDIDLLFQHAAGDLSLYLHADDLAHTQIAYSISVTDNEHISEFVTGGTAYFIRVVGNGGDVNPGYDLLIDGPDIVGDRFEPNNGPNLPASLGTGAVVETGLSIHASGSDDYYRWTAPATGNVNFQLIFQHSQGDLDMQLYRGESLLAGSYSGNDDEGFWCEVIEGNAYTIRVYGYAGAVNPDYDLGLAGPGTAIQPDAYEVNDSFAAAYHLGTGDRSLWNLTLHGSPGTYDDDYFSWVAPAAGMAEVDLLFDHDVGDVELYVYDSAYGGVGSATSSDDDEHLDLPIQEGELYYLRVIGSGGVCHFDYDLVIDAPDIPADHLEANNSFAGARAFGVGDRYETDLTVHEYGNHDYYKWVAAADGTLDVHLYFQHQAGDIDLVLYDGTTAPMTGSYSIDDDEHILEAEIIAGQAYYVGVHPIGSALQYDYTLHIDGPDILPDHLESNDTYATAADLADDTIAVNDLTFHAVGDVDWFQWTAPATGMVGTAIFFGHDHGDLDLAILDRRLRLLGASESLTDNEGVSVWVESGWVYYILVRSRTQAMHDHYELLIEAPPPNADLFGTVWYDGNADGGRDVGEAGLAGWTVFLDTDGDRVLDGDEEFTMTEADGAYRFLGLPAGTYTVDQVSDSRCVQTHPGPGFHTVTLAPGEVRPNVDFANVLLADANGDRSVDGGDYTIWADHYNQPGGWGEGDFSRNEFVDGGDYTIWADNYGATVGAAEVLAAVAYDAGDASAGAPAGMLALAALPGGRSTAGTVPSLSGWAGAGAGRGRVMRLVDKLIGATMAAGANQEAEQLPEGSGGRKASGRSLYARLGRRLPAVEAELNLLQEPDLTVLAAAI